MMRVEEALDRRTSSQNYPHAHAVVRCVGQDEALMVRALQNRPVGVDESRELPVAVGYLLTTC